MKFGYADPPYLGCGSLYAKHHPEAHIWDRPETHRALIERLSDDYPDGWALSASAPSLATLLPMLPPHRICVWVKTFAVFKPNVGIAFAWEPVILVGGRRRTRAQPTIRDWLACASAMNTGLIGAKPVAFARWVLELLNVQRGDQVDDLFPGTGVVGKCAAARADAPTLDDMPLGLVGFPSNASDGVPA